MKKIKIPSSIIQNFVKTNFPEAKETSSGEIHFNSPFVKDGKLRLYVNPSQSNFFDQKQQIGGSFINFVASYLGVDNKQASVILLKDYFSKDNEEVTYKDVINQTSSLELPEGLIFFSDGNPESRTYKLAKIYLHKRNIPLDGLGYIYDPKGDFKTTFHNRIFIPFYEDGELVYYICRAFDNSSLRYKNPKGVDAGNYVFNIDNLQDDIFIFEGVFDAMSLTGGQQGTAMLSNKMKQIQITKILDRAPKRIIFVTENDINPIAIEVGRRNLFNNIKDFIKYKPLSLNIEFLIYNIPKGYKDFNEFSVKTGTNYINIENCIPWKQQKFDLTKFKWSGKI